MKKKEVDLHLHTGVRRRSAGSQHGWAVHADTPWPHVELGDITRTFRVECSSATENHFIHSSHESVARRPQHAAMLDIEMAEVIITMIATVISKQLPFKISSADPLSPPSPILFKFCNFARLVRLHHIQTIAGFLNISSQFRIDTDTNCTLRMCPHAAVAPPLAILRSPGHTVLVLVLLTNVFGVRFSGAGNAAHNVLVSERHNLPVPTLALPHSKRMPIFTGRARIACVLRRMARR